MKTYTKDIAVPIYNEILTVGTTKVTTLSGGLPFVRGDKFAIRRRIKLALGTTIDEAWLTVKTALGDTDASAIFQKKITNSDSPGTGHIEDTGSSTGTAVVRFDVVTVDSETMNANQEYFYDIQVKVATTNDIHTVESGKQVATDQATRDT